MQGRQILAAGLWWRVGNGALIRVKEDAWLPTTRDFRMFSIHDDMPNLVADLIDQDMHCWNQDMVEKFFTPEEAQVILRIPLSRSSFQYKLIWHYTRDGCYSVKTGYELAMEMEAKGELGRRGVGVKHIDQPQSGLWQHIWKMDVPSKYKHFIWRCCCHALVVRSNLVRMNVDIVDECRLCTQPGEDEGHLFFRCEFATAFWATCLLQLAVDGIPSVNFVTGWEHMYNQYKSNQKAIRWLVIGLWRIWKARNEVVFNGANVMPAECVKVAMNQFDELEQAFSILSPPIDESHVMSITSIRNTSWSRPEFGTLKVNCDGAWDARRGSGGYGWIVRNMMDG